MKYLLLVSLLLATGPVVAADFLIEDVCVDAADHAIAGDPASCAAHRDVREGETIPYLHVDRGAWWSDDYQHFQAFASFPAGGFIVVAKDFGGDDLYTTFGIDDPCSHNNCGQAMRDGYDLIEDQGDFVSIVATSDPALNGQTFWRDGCAAGSSDPAGSEDSWLLFPTGLKPGDSGNRTAHLTITTDGRCPGRGFNAAYTQWSYLPAPFTYTSGKSLDTIVSTHFAGDSPEAATSFERFYFTREYGYTRWEAWRRNDQCGAGGCMAKSIGCDGPISEAHGASGFTRTDCRDAGDVLEQAWDPAPFIPEAQVYEVQPDTVAAPAGGAMGGLEIFGALAALVARRRKSRTIR